MHLLSSNAYSGETFAIGENFQTLCYDWSLQGGFQMVGYIHAD